jgi:hypothetical protein
MLSALLYLDSVNIIKCGNCEKESTGDFLKDFTTAFPKPCPKVPTFGTADRKRFLTTAKAGSLLGSFW